MQITIAGHGFVGSTVASAIDAAGIECWVVDPKYNQNKISDCPDADGIIVAVNTPTVDGKCDPTNLYNVLDQIPETMPVCIKSTITPDIVEHICRKYKNHYIVIYPEFLRERCAKEDFENQRSIILGGDIRFFWQDIFKKVLPNVKLFHHCSPVEAMLVKYFRNSYLAVKSSYFNHVSDICKELGTNFDNVRNLVCQDTRIGSGQTLVPGPDGQEGWGGNCLPKDTEAFLFWCGIYEISFDVLQAAVEYNKTKRNNVDKT